jgi:hypothetical protein
LPTTALVVDGIYGRTRNPLYLGLTLVYLGFGVAAGSRWAIGLVVPLLWVINVGVVKREERYLERKFGDGYRLQGAGAAMDLMGCVRATHGMEFEADLSARICKLL